MKVAIIGTVGVPACYGGYETLVENLLNFKQDDSIKYQIYCSGNVYKDRIKTYKGANLVYIPFNANGAQSVIYDSISMIHAFATCDIIVSLGTVGSFVLPLIKLFSKKSIIFNLDGLDDKREKFNSFSQKVIAKARKIAARHGSICIADNKGIQDYASRVYKRSTELIEYGGDQVFPVFDDKKLLDKYNLAPKEYCFKVARIEPENNIEMILKVFAQLPSEKLVIVGNWNKSTFGKLMRDTYSKYKNIVIMDAIYEPEEINLLRSNCKLYIHGHSAGGTNPSLVEAMNLSLPILAYGVVYNKETTEYKASYFTDEISLLSAVKSLSENQHELNIMGAEMFDIAKRRYTWKRICELYENVMTKCNYQ